MRRIKQKLVIKQPEIILAPMALMGTNTLAQLGKKETPSKKRRRERRAHLQPKPKTAEQIKKEKEGFENYGKF